MREALYAAIQKALLDLGVPDAPFVVERPGDMSHGDYYTNAAMKGYPALQDSLKLTEPFEIKRKNTNVRQVVGAETYSNPMELAQSLKRKLDGKISGVEKIEVKGAFVNFFLSHEVIAGEIEKIARGEFGEIKSDLKGQTVMVEYTSPNLFKPLHIGNLVGNILGEAITRLLEAGGADVKRINYPSDIGLTVAKGVWGLKKEGLDPSKIEDLGRAYVLGNAAYEAESGEGKKEIEEINRALYANSDPELSLLRAKGIETSRRHLADLCARLGTRFDTEIFESQSGPLGREIVGAHLADGIFEQSDGAIVYKGEQEGLHTRVFINSQGLPTYEAKDVGLFSLKQKSFPDFDISITVTGSEQKEYFKVVFAAIKKVFTKETEGKGLLHIANGFLKLTTGKMSSRLGNVITGESLLIDLKDAAKEKMEGRELKDAEKTAEQIAVGAIKYAVLKQGSGKDIVFDPEKSLSLQGDSGPYLQYARVRALSIMKAAKDAGITAGPGEEKSPVAARATLERTLIHFTEVIERAAQELEPHYVTTYLTELASAFNSWYMAERVVGGPNPAYALLLTEAFENVLKKGLNLLGIPAPEEM